MTQNRLLLIGTSTAARMRRGGWGAGLGRMRRGGGGAGLGRMRRGGGGVYLRCVLLRLLQLGDGGMGPCFFLSR